jgi:hypothetical protein
MVQHVFETVEKEQNAKARIEREDPYSLTSKYTGVARSLVATITKAVRHTGTVPVSTPAGQSSPTDHHSVRCRRTHTGTGV